MKKGTYFLHIPRTSGVFIREIVMSHCQENQKSFLSSHMFNIEQEEFKNKDFISGHYGLTPIPYVEKTFTILRDPVERSFSYMKYIWQHFYNHMTISEAFDLFLKNKNFKSLLSNQQSYFLTSEINIEEYNKHTGNTANHVMSNWYLITNKIYKQSVIDSIKKNNIQVLFFDDPELYKKILKIYRIEKTDNIKFDQKINESTNTEKEFYSKYYNQICEINKIDIDVYNFFKGETNNDYE